LGRLGVDYGQEKLMAVAFRIVNVVATAVLDQPVDLESLHEIFVHEVIHDQEIYGGRVAYFKSKNMEGKVSIFRSGKMISIGTRSEQRAAKELKLVARTLKAGLKEQPKTQSIVATADIKTSIDLESFLNQIQEEKQFHIIYEPEQFPGAIIKFPVAQGVVATVLLFTSGKLVCVGLTRYDYVQSALELLTSRLTVCKQDL
jgi:TATA-box binding protein (TBP) (component of TFIID and TFIIIB)